MNKQISIKKVKFDAEEVFRIGGFYCSEAVVSSIRKNIDPDMPIELVKGASGFPIGVGKSKCLCGAVGGAVIALSYFFGRESTIMPDSKKCLDLTAELQQRFRDNHKNVLCCHVQTKGMDMASGEHKRQCIAFTGEMAAVAAEIIARELKLSVV